MPWDSVCVYILLWLDTDSHPSDIIHYHTVDGSEILH